MNENKITRLEKLVQDSKPIFDKVNKIGAELREGVSRDLSYYEKTLDVLSGCYTYIYPIYKKLEAQKKNTEVAHYVLLKNNAEEKEEKFVSASADREASYFVKELRLARNIFEGYAVAAEVNINTCKKHLSTDVEGNAGF